MSEMALQSEHGALPLSPIDRPKGLFVRFLFRATRSRYGMTPTAFRVLYARSPFLGFFSLVIYAGLFFALRIERQLFELVSIAVAQGNGCTFCVDLKMAELVKQRIGTERFRDLSNFEPSSAFTAREKAALRYVRALNASLHVPDEVWRELRSVFSERECVDLVWVCAIERYFNSMTLPLRIGSDHLEAQIVSVSAERERASASRS